MNYISKKFYEITCRFCVYEREINFGFHSPKISHHMYAYIIYSERKRNVREELPSLYNKTLHTQAKPFLIMEPQVLLCVLFLYADTITGLVVILTPGPDLQIRSPLSKVILQDLCVNTGSVTTYCSVHPEKAHAFSPCSVQRLEVCVIRAVSTQPSVFCSGIMPDVFSGTASVLNDHGTSAS